MKEYVCGFLFSRPTDDEGQKVVLIRKNRPEWQAGRLNGVGGKFEEDIDPSFQSAMVREFHEETGVLVHYDEWTLFCVYGGVSNGERYRVYFFKASPEVFPQVTSKTDEDVEIVYTRVLPSDVIFNLNWLIPLANDKSLNPDKPVFVVE
jgi:8-oxo-dGTP diphosphatase